MKKKIVSIVCLSLFALMMGFQTANACTGGIYYAASLEEAGEISDEAEQNCCAGDVITINDFFGNSITYTVQSNGPNSSCA